MSEFSLDQFNYIEHLQLESLLNSHKQVSPHPEEHLFIIIHQAYELWFKQLIHDTRRTIDHLQADELPQAIWLLQRAGRILQVADTQLSVLEMLSCADFQEFRPYLEQSSGLQSRQFRLFEVLGGLCETEGHTYQNWAERLWPGITSEVEMTLHAAFLQAIERSGHSLLAIYQNRWHQFQLFSLCEACLDLDRWLVTWRQNHIKMVMRMIGGAAQGTGGTFVEKYLEPTTKYRFFPELWALRNELTAVSGGQVAKKRPLSPSAA